MKKLFVIAALPLAALGMVAPRGVDAGEIIAHPDLNLHPADVREVFIGEKQLSGHTKLVPVDNAAVQADFAAKVLKLEVPKYAALWTKKAFREGLNAPAVKGSDAEVAAYVRATPGALGYVATPQPGVKVVQKF